MCKTAAKVTILSVVKQIGWRQFDLLYNAWISKAESKVKHTSVCISDIPERTQSVVLCIFPSCWKSTRHRCQVSMCWRKSRRHFPALRREDNLYLVWSRLRLEWRLVIQLFIVGYKYILSIKMYRIWKVSWQNLAFMKTIIFIFVWIQE